MSVGTAQVIIDRYLHGVTSFGCLSGLYNEGQYCGGVF